MRLALVFCLSLMGCGHLIEMTQPPADWPQLSIVDHGADGTIANCSAYTSIFTWPPLGCAVVDFDRMVCDVWAMTGWVYREEVKHCQGRDHYDDDTLAKEWERHKVKEMLKFFKEHAGK